MCVGPQRQAPLVGLDRFVGERGGRERSAAQEVRLRIVGIQRDSAVEALQRFGKPVLFLEQPAQIQNRRQKVGRQRDRPLEQLSASSSRPDFKAIEASRRIASTLRGRCGGCVDTDARPP